MICKPIISMMLLMTAAGTVLPAQTPPELRVERVIEGSYLRVTFLSGLGPVSKAAIDSYFGDPINEEQVRQQIGDATVIFNISNFRSGLLSSILNQPWLDYYSVAAGPERQLTADVVRFNLTDGSLPPASWPTIKIVPMDALGLPKDLLDKISKMTVQQALDEQAKPLPPIEGAPAVPASDIRYQWYAAFNLQACYANKCQTNKAIWLFGRDSKGVEKALPMDGFSLLAGDPASIGKGPENLFPDQLLNTNVSKQPLMAEYLHKYSVTGSNCHERMNDYCYSEGRLGIYPNDLNRVIPEGGKASGSRKQVSQ